MKDENQQRVKKQIQHRACHEPDHGFHGEALIAQDIVKDKAARDEGRAEQDKAAVGARVGQDRLGTAEKAQKLIEKETAPQGHKDPEAYCRQKTGGGDAARALAVPLPEQPGDLAAGALPEHEADSLQDRHIAEHHADRAGGRGAKPPDEGGVRHIVDAGDQHADRCRDAETHD